GRGDEEEVRQDQEEAEVDPGRDATQALPGLEAGDVDEGHAAAAGSAPGVAPPDWRMAQKYASSRSGVTGVNEASGAVSPCTCSASRPATRRVRRIGQRAACVAA